MSNVVSITPATVGNRPMADHVAPLADFLLARLQVRLGLPLLAVTGPHVVSRVISPRTGGSPTCSGHRSGNRRTALAITAAASEK